MKLNIKKELLKLSKERLVELIISLPIGSNGYETASIIHQALRDYANLAFEDYHRKTENNVSLSTLKKQMALTDELMRVGDLDTDEIKNQLITLFREASKKRDEQRQLARRLIMLSFDKTTN